MKRNLFGQWVVAVAVASITLLAANVIEAQGTDLYSFRAPAGWQDYTHTNLADRAVAIWRGPTDTKFGENILVIVKPSRLSLEQATDQGSVRASMPGAQVSNQRVTICGGHPAMYVYIVAPWHGNTLISENVISVWDNMGFSATYSRLSYQQTVEAARSALMTLCPGSAGSSSTSW
jgi:hypothetical protein